MALVLFLAGCSTIAEPAEPPPRPTIVRQVLLPQKGVTIALLKTRAVIELDETYAVLDGNTGCHRILGSFTLNDETGEASFTVPGVSSGTCADNDAAIEARILEALAATTAFSRLETQLDLYDSEQNLVMSLRPIS